MGTEVEAPKAPAKKKKAPAPKPTKKKAPAPKTKTKPTKKTAPTKKKAPNGSFEMGKPCSLKNLEKRPYTRTTVSKYQEVIDLALKLKTGQMFEVTPPKGKAVTDFRNTLATVLRGKVIDVTGKKLRFYCTVNDTVAVVAIK